MRLVFGIGLGGDHRIVAGQARRILFLRQDQAGLLDRIYSLFYVAINIGSATSQIATPWLLAGCAFGAV